MKVSVIFTEKFVWKGCFMKKILMFAVFAVLFCAAGSPAKSPYAKKVKQVSSGDVYLRISSERQRGETCNPTSMSMILEYYGIRISSKELQKDSDKTDAYKTSGYLQNQLKKYKMQMLPLPMIKGKENVVFESVKRAIDCGLPMQWLVDLLKAPNYDVSKKHKRQIIKNGGQGGHARVFNGYKINRRTKKIEYFIFTDSWGMKHRKKEIKYADVPKMTYGFYIVVPESLPIEVIKYIYEPLQKAGLTR